MTAAREIDHDPAERGLRILAEMFEEAAAVLTSERPILRLVSPDDRADGEV